MNSLSLCISILIFVSFLILHVTSLLIFGMFSELVFVLCENYVFEKLFLVFDI